MFSEANVAIATAEKKKEKLDKECRTATEELARLDSQLADADERLQTLQAQLQECKGVVTTITGEELTQSEQINQHREMFEATKHAVDQARGDELALANQLEDEQRLQNECQARHAALTNDLQRLTGQKADLDLANLLDTLESDEVSATPRSWELRLFSEEEIQTRLLQGYDPAATKHQIQEIKQHMAQMSPNMSAILEYRKRRQLVAEKSQAYEQASLLLEEQRARYEDLRRQRSEMFLAGFTVIQHKLKEMYQLLTRDGDADLEFVDSLDPFCAGILFIVRPPKKSWKSVSNLSGGEKTLSSLALIFALHHFRPTPLYVMDEIDAALDFRNVDIVAKYGQHRTKNAQFIIISLRNHMFEPANRLVGIYKTHNCTKSVAIDPRKFHLPKGPLLPASSQSDSSQPSSSTPASSSSSTAETHGASLISS
jgi:structural maintenance of chromosome 4